LARRPMETKRPRTAKKDRHAKKDKKTKQKSRSRESSPKHGKRSSRHNSSSGGNKSKSSSSEKVWWSSFRQRLPVLVLRTEPIACAQSREAKRLARQKKMAKKTKGRAKVRGGQGTTWVSAHEHTDTLPTDASRLRGVHGRPLPVSNLTLFHERSLRWLNFVS